VKKRVECLCPKVAAKTFSSKNWGKQPAGREKRNGGTGKGQTKRERLRAIRRARYHPDKTSGTKKIGGRGVKRGNQQMGERVTTNRGGKVTCRGGQNKEKDENNGANRGRRSRTGGRGGRNSQTSE